MCKLSEEDTRTDVKKKFNFKKGDICICNLDEEDGYNGSYFSKTGLIGKSRPCLIFSTEEYNKDFRNTYTVIPIKSNNTGLTTEEYVSTSLDIITPIWIHGTEKFIIITQARPLSVKRIGGYVGTITNPKVLDKVDELFMATHFCDKNKAEFISEYYGNFNNALNFLCSEEAKKAYSENRM